MNCQVAASKLSAYLDGELDSIEQADVHEHISNCEHCREELRAFERLGEELRNSEAPVDIDSMWSSIESRLNHVRSPGEAWHISRLSGFAIAASVLLAVGGIAWMSQINIEDADHIARNHSSLAVDFQPVIEFASTDPAKALGGLVEKYHGKQLSDIETIKYLGYKPSASKSVPSGFKLVSTHVLDMPCCKCVASICQRENGSSLIVFEHKDEQPLWFGEKSSKVERCAGVECRIVEMAGNLAVSWRKGERQFTMIGAADREEVDKWIRTTNL